MKKIIKILVLVLCVTILFSMQKLVSFAEETKSQDVESITVENTVKEDETFTYRLYVDKLDMYTYSKGHNGKHIIRYSINGGEIVEMVMGLDVVEKRGNQPLYVAHYIDVEGVKTGDVIEYEYGYNNNYLFPDEVEDFAFRKGKKIVK